MNPKGKRGDTEQRKKKNKNTEFTILKTTLKSFVKSEVYELLRKPLEHILKNSNKAILEAYNLANIHTLRLLNNNLPVNPDQDFYYKCLSSVGNSSSTIKDKFFKESVDFYKSLRPTNYEVADSSYISTGIFQNLSLQMATNASNFVEMRFFTFFKRYLKHKHSLEGKVAYAYITAIQNDKYEGKNNLVIEYRNRIISSVNDLKTKHGYKEPDSFSKLFKDPIIVLPILHEILKYNESIHEACETKKIEVDKGVRLFTLLPTKKGFTMSHIKICKNGLHGFIKHIEKIHPAEISILLNEIGIDLKKFTTKTIKGYEDDIWNLFFDVKKFVKSKKGSTFGDEILTDGKSVSITFKKYNPIQKETNKKKAKKEKSVKNLEKIHSLNLSSYKEVWGLDPGRTSTFVATNRKGETISVSSRSYYDDAKFIESGRILRGWVEKDGINNINKYIPTNKTTSMDNLIKYNKHILQKVDTLLSFYGEIRIRNQRMKRYMYSQKALRSMCEKITKKHGKKTLVGFGDWSATDNGGLIKKCPAGPVKKLENMLKQYCTIVSVDEFKTSKVHNDCKCECLKHCYSEVLKKYKGEDKKTLKNQKIHSILFCTNKNCNGITMNRDVNASTNILEILLHEVKNKTRHPSFLRTKEDPSKILEEQIKIGVDAQADIHNQLVLFKDIK